MNTCVYNRITLSLRKYLDRIENQVRQFQDGLQRGAKCVKQFFTDLVSLGLNLGNIKNASGFRGCTISDASRSVKGYSRKIVSFSNSVYIPPRPNMINCPIASASCPLLLQFRFNHWLEKNTLHSLTVTFFIEFFMDAIICFFDLIFCL